MSVRVRIAPSPTGNLHIGTARLAIWNYLYAKKNNGTLVLRIEDTDKARSTKAFEENIIESLKYLGVEYDEFYRQSERTELYKKYIEKLIADGKAYISKEEAREEGGRDEVIRFKNPNKIVKFTDLIRGEVSMDTTDLGDFVIAKDFNEPLFHLVVVIDDYEMKISHILRGEDHISNTPRQILIQEAIGAPTPFYAHLPMVLATDRSKMSKRHGAVSLTEYRQKGYLREALVNFLAMLGWNPGTEQEIFSLPELIDAFEIPRINKSGAIFNVEKLNWFNREYILRLPKDVLFKEIKERTKRNNDEIIEKIIPIVLDRIVLLGDIDEMEKSGELSFFFEKPEYDKALLYPKNVTDVSLIIKHLEKAKELLENVSEWSAENIKESLWDYSGEVGRGNVLWPLRTCLTGKEKSPDPFSVAFVLGKNETFDRINRAVNFLNS